ncbi:MAG: M20/M25/M40 family metallo-hydrolase, partial [Phycisphaerales bacterium]
EEGRDNSQVWQYLTHLCEEIGPRLTGSTRMMMANTWTRDTFASFGLHNARLQKVGEHPVRFDRGECRARMVEPVERDFEFSAPAWSAGTDGPLSASLIKMPRTLEELEAVEGELDGKWVLSKDRPRRRWRRRRSEEDDAARQLREEIEKRVREAGIAGRIIGSSSEIVHTDGRDDWDELDFGNLPTGITVSVRRSDYDAMNSRLADGEEVVVEVDLQHHFAEGPFPLFNTIAEIPGTEWPEQAVIISGHMDSWDGPGSQGAQDNGTGTVVTLEAARILTAAGVKPKRTIRFILWVGEEQGFIGSRGYLESLSEEERAGITAVFVDDGGTNYEGSLSCTEDMVEILTAAVAPVGEAFPDMPVEIQVRERMRGGGSDHAPFIRAGIPGFFWGERGSGGRDGADYGFIWHTQNDRLRYAVPEYLVQSATCSAITAYNLAMADEVLPRVERRGPDRGDRRPPDDENWNTVEGPLSGKWQGMPAGEEVPEDAGFTITMEMSDDGRVRGNVQSRMGDSRLRRASFDAETGTLRFMTFNEYVGPIRFEATVSGEEMTGTLSGEEGFTMSFTAKRVKEAEPAEQTPPAEGGEGAPPEGKAEETPPAEKDEAAPPAEKGDEAPPPEEDDKGDGDPPPDDTNGGGG